MMMEIMNPSSSSVGNFNLMSTSRLLSVVRTALCISPRWITQDAAPVQAWRGRLWLRYCAAQCPVGTWINGTFNTNSQSACCNEMDIWETNANASALTPHPCEGDTCDKSGCGFNPYAMGDHTYYGNGDTIDTLQPFTVVTQLYTPMITPRPARSPSSVVSTSRTARSPRTLFHRLALTP